MAELNFGLRDADPTALPVPGVPAPFMKVSLQSGTSASPTVCPSAVACYWEACLCRGLAAWAGPRPGAPPAATEAKPCNTTALGTERNSCSLPLFCDKL